MSQDEKDEPATPPKGTATADTEEPQTPPPLPTEPEGGDLEGGKGK